MADYPYMTSNKNLPVIFEKIRSAAKPAKFTNNFIRQLGFLSTNDRGFAPLLKKLGFLADDGTPNSYYDALRDPNTSKAVLGDRIRDLYSDLYTINTEIHKASDDDIKGAIARVTGKDARDVARIFVTFKALVSLADFSKKKTPISVSVEKQELSPQSHSLENKKTDNGRSSPDFHYNIQIHLPATTDISVYNAIFKSLKEHIL